MSQLGSDRTTYAWWGCCILPRLPETGPVRGKNEPRRRRLNQQALGACKPLLDTVWVVFFFLAIGAVLIPIGAVCVAYGIKPISVSQRYDQDCFSGFNGSTNTERQQYIWQNAANDALLSCTIELSISQNMDPPIYFFYELNGLFQNNRRYVVSRSDQQLVNKANPDTTYCTEELNYAGNSSQTINPCGLTAWTNFNDTYAATLQRGSPAITTILPISSSGFAPYSDQTYMFAEYNASYFNPTLNEYRGGANITVPVQSDDRFIVWMKLAPLPLFYKLWGVISTPLLAGDQVQVSIVNRFNSFAFDGQKSVVLSTTTWLGVSNPFLGIAFLVTGIISVALAALYFVSATWISPRAPGDLSVLRDWVGK